MKDTTKAMFTKIGRMLINGLKRLSIFVADRAQIAATNMKKQQDKNKDENYLKTVMANVKAQNEGAKKEDMFANAQQDLFNTKF